jgi:hypothetical protein
MPAMRRDVSFRPAPLVRGGSRRITIMRFRPANISVINRRDSHAGKLRCNERVSSGTGLPRSRGRPERDLLNKGVDRSLHISRLLKKLSVAFSATPLARRDSLVAYIFNGLQPSKMAPHPVPPRRQPKNRVFQQPADMERPVHPFI